MKSIAGVTDLLSREVTDRFNAQGCKPPNRLLQTQQQIIPSTSQLAHSENSSCGARPFLIQHLWHERRNEVWAHLIFPMVQ